MPGYGGAWVIASGTAFTYKDKPNDAAPDRPRSARPLRFGRQREERAGPQVQVNAQLVDTESGTNYLANSFAYETGSLLDIQDNLMHRVPPR